MLVRPRAFVLTGQNLFSYSSLSRAFARLLFAALARFGVTPALEFQYNTRTSTAEAADVEEPGPLSAHPETEAPAIHAPLRSLPRTLAGKNSRSVNRSARHAMSLVGLLATTTIISSLANSMPSVSAAEQRVKLPSDYDRLLFVLLLNPQDLGFKTESPNEPSDSGYLYGNLDGGGRDVGEWSASRDKRIGSLSIVNSVDVLRQRVLLELARRKAMEDQRQISENRRILDSVGKRSGNPEYGSAAATAAAASARSRRRLERLLLRAEQ